MRKFVKAGLKSAAVLCLLVSGAALDGATVTRGPFLQAAGTNRMALCWRTDVPTTTEVRYGTALDGPLVSEAVPGTRTEHVVPLVGLEPATRYYYAISGTPASGAPVQVGGVDHWFRTAPEDLAGEVARFWVVGDSGYLFAGPLANYNAYMAQTAAAGKTTAGFLMLGDNAYDVGAESQIQAAVFNRYAALLRNTPAWSALGNHDVYTVSYPFTDSTPYDTAFYFPTAGQSGGLPSGSVRFYSFDHGDIHFISLDTSTGINALDGPGDPQGMVDWLQADLRECGAHWIVAFMHYGPYSKGSHDSDTEGAHVRKHIIPLLEEYGVDLVLCGHSHVYERSGLIDGHYGTAATWNAAMLKQGGNGSDAGGVDAAGVFRDGAGTGSYRKPAATGRAGAVYVVCGASGAQQGWWGGSTALVAPNPHPAHVTSLNLLGSVVLEIGRSRLNARYLDISGATRDDFTLLKGSCYTLHPMDPAFAAPASRGASFAVTRTGALLAEDVSLGFEDAAGNSVSPGVFSLPFAAGQSFASTTLPAPAGAAPGMRFSLQINLVQRAVVPGAAPRAAHAIETASQPVEFASTPAGSWFATWFPGRVPTEADWLADADSDGRSNLLEYAFGGDPTRPDTTEDGALAVEGGNIALRFVRPFGRSDLAYHVEEGGVSGLWTRVSGVAANDGPPTARGEPRKVEVPMRGRSGLVRMAVELTGG